MRVRRHARRNADFEIGTRLAPALGRHLNELSYAFAIQHGKRILLQNAFSKIRGQHFVDCVSREAERGLCEVIGADEKTALPGTASATEGGPRQLDDGADHVIHFSFFFFFEYLLRRAIDVRGLIGRFLQRSDQRRS